MGGGLNFTGEQAHQAADKVGLPQGKKRAPHRTAWYELGGRKLFRVSIPRHGTFGDGTKKRIVNSFRLDNSDFLRLARCPMSADEYRRHIETLVKQRLL